MASNSLQALQARAARLGTGMGFRLRAAGAAGLALALVASPLATAAAGTAPAAATALAGKEASIVAGFAPHRAVYDLALDNVESNAAVSDVGGRMVYEITGGACEGFSVNFRMVTEVQDDEGGNRLTDLRTTSYESGTADSYQFLTQNFVDQDKDDETKGAATRKDGKTRLDLIEPKKLQAEIDPAALFPTQHLARLVAAGEAGQRIVQADLFDGSEDGQKVYATTAVIGPTITGADTPDDDDPKAVAALKGIPHWPVRLSYFDIEDGPVGEQTPVYEMSFLLYANGVTRRLKLDYGDFVVSSNLKTIEMLPKAACAK